MTPWCLLACILQMASLGESPGAASEHLASVISAAVQGGGPRDSLRSITHKYSHKRANVWTPET